MEIVMAEIPNVSNQSNQSYVSWKQVAVTKYEKLRGEEEGQPIKEVIETIKPVLYIAKDGKVEIESQGTFQTINILA